MAKGAPKEKKAKVVDPNKPKRQPSSFMKYSNQVRPDVVKANPGKKITEIATIIGAQWRSLSEAEKNKYK
jgi:hypothetical protein